VRDGAAKDDLMRGSMRFRGFSKEAVPSTIILASVLTFVCGAQRAAAEDRPEPLRTAYRSPCDVAVSPDGKAVYVSDATAQCVEILDAIAKAKRSEIPLQGEPQGLCLSPDGGALYVAERGAGTVAVIDTASASLSGRISVGRWPVDVALAANAKRLFVCNQDRHSVSVVDLSQSPPQPIKDIAVVREPSCIALTADEQFAVVANQIPLGISTDPALAAEITILDVQTLVSKAAVKLPPGSTVINGVCASPDGKWAYAVHGLGHFNLPMTQLERGWVNTYALSIIDVGQGSLLATLLLDDLTQGAADPFAVACSRDGSRLWISHAGVHEISIVDIARLHELLQGHVTGDLAQLMDGAAPNIWVRIQHDPARIDDLAYDLTALYIANAIRRVPSGGKGPRGIALSPDEQTLLVANFFSGSVAELHATQGTLQGTIALGPAVEPDAARRGNLLFHDATHAFQRWHSCASCHPNGGRIDGLRWDFADDGLGNGMNTPNVFFSDQTAPLHRQGTLASTRELAKHGLTFTHMIVPTEEEVDDLAAYLGSLEADTNPNLTADGKLTETAERGKALFSGKAQCATCHQGPYFTDQKLYDVGVDSPNYPDAKFKTANLIELHRTAPYLHDGRALTLRDVLTTCNPSNEHGTTSGLSEGEIDDLVAYLSSL
jgi:YVTN family beta-propeller protein